MLQILFYSMLITSFNYFFYPKEWRRNRKLHIVLLIAHLIGVSSLVFLGYGFHNLQDGFVKSLIIIIETFYFSMIALSGTCFAIYLIIYFIFFRKREGKIADIFRNRGLVVRVVTIVCLGITIFGYCNIDDLKITNYTIKSTKECLDSNVRIAVIADAHLGAGAGKDVIDETVKIINDMNAHMLLLVGDLTDETSSLYDIEYFTEPLKKGDTEYGIYYVEGNHEQHCRTDIEPYLIDANVQMMDGKAVELPNGMIILGQEVYSTTSTNDILENSGIDASNKPVITMRHDPREFEQYDGHSDVVVSGHTHGIRYPMVLPSHAYHFDLIYGFKTYPKGLHAITTSGISGWGFHFKWNSISEVVQLDINFEV